MASLPDTHVAPTDAELDSLVTELDATVHTRTGLHSWVKQSSLRFRAVADSDELTYIELESAEQRRGRPVVMLLEGVWERIL